MKKEEKSLLFFEKKRSKKNFVPAFVAPHVPHTQGAKVFLVLFFQKKNCFLSSCVFVS
jgi:hypothetical protein